MSDLTHECLLFALASLVGCALVGRRSILTAGMFSLLLVAIMLILVAEAAWLTATWLRGLTRPSTRIDRLNL